MSNPNIKPSDRVTLLDKIDPVSQAAGTVNGNWVDIAQIDNVLAVIHAGALGTSATLDFKLQQAQDTSGTGAKDVTGKAITQLTQAGSNSNSLALVNCRSDELDVTNKFHCVRFVATVGTAASLIAAYLYGFDARYQAKAQPTAVAQVV